MLDYLAELNELKDLFNDLGNYSKTNAFMLQILFERYDGVIGQLYNINNKMFKSSVDIITEIENDLNILGGTEIPSFKKKMLFEKNKFKLKIAVYKDIGKYGHCKMIEQIIYN
ncbi:hypothetical protein [Mucilaginibacter pocheonensis]|uniref:Protein-arginine kinase n=1 Tax=Mucilaginibacter pocheonensis TaxID=398050 RepID=A0ABU1T8G5_9SPHI|nr:hypothetical protein [Mucilaginibacter pocheonensis]MDR6941510.1 protein-arginine kinase [Mucilaginibacter pocheonensis]